MEMIFIIENNRQECLWSSFPIVQKKNVTIEAIKSILVRGDPFEIKLMN